MKCKLSLISALLSVSFGAKATLDIDLSGLGEGENPPEINTKKLNQTIGSGTAQASVPESVPGSIQETVSANGRYHQSTSVSSSVYSSQGAITGLRRNVELVAPKRPSLLLSAPEVLANDISFGPGVSPTISQPMSPTLSSTLSFENMPEIEVADAKDDESMLSFLDEWLGIDPVKPWEKGTLAEKAMKPGGVVPEFDRFSEKVFSYKQGSVGGSGVGGGGCGCN
ncbi:MULTISPECIES: DUF4266 domain-containing protein [Shewanella]|uniref:DUF4266 domain-containing protein n=1 Tax=Shewanella TaxID=22 RepID=UPI001D155DD6|nr:MULTISPECIES: DUF4266 domain-containing protein [Shewanella]